MKNIGSYPNVRLRRNRKMEWSRRLVSESNLSADDLIWPIFIREGENIKEPVKTMPGVYRYTLDKIQGLVEKAINKKIPMIALFPSTPISKKNAKGSEALNKNNLVCKTLRLIKKNYPDLCVQTDVALDPYTTHGHDGLVIDGEIVNDESVEVLCKMALSHAEAGADWIAPSDMMDGRIGAIRNALDVQGFSQVGILAYSAKYASSFFGPFRGALQSAPKSGNKKTYQMDPANIREALKEIALDLEEGADVVMIKPALCYLDVISRVREAFDAPVAAYNVSGEYAMVVAAAEKGWVDRDSAMMEMLLSIRRAGADMILTYFAKDAAALLRADYGSFR